MTAGLGDLVDTAVILAGRDRDATIGFIQEGGAEQAMDAIGKNPLPAHGPRDGKRRSVDSAEVERAISSCSRRARRLPPICG